ncbi:MAG: histone methylation protein DOT1-domain-containing protein, partial [Piptocephalis tieghemiana]
NYDPIQDILSTITVISRCILPDRIFKMTGSESPSAMGKRIVREMRVALRRMDQDMFVDLVSQYNTLLEKFRSGLLPQDNPSRGSFELVSHLLLQVYNRVVSPQVEKLRQYKAFSNNVYGEINPILTNELLQRCKVDSNGVFLDLGCGIGNVVIQAGAQTGCEAYGVEIMSEPARLGQAQVTEFIARSRCYKLDHGPIEVIHGDFLEIPRVAQLLSRATVVLANNYAFDSALNQRLLALFLELQDGAKIISLRSFVPNGHRITERNAGSVESILKVQTHRYPPGSVSWTGAAGYYYIHEVDRRPVEDFWRKIRETRRG